MFGSTKRAKCLEQASAETLVTMVLDQSDSTNQVDEAKNEADVPLGTQ